MAHALRREMRDRCTDAYPSRGTSEPRVLPRHDPVVYEGWHAKAPLSQQQTEFYRANGFLVLKETFSPAEFQSLQKQAKALLTDASRVAPETVIPEPESDFTRSIFKIHAQDALFGRLSCDARLVEIARFLLGDDVYIHQSRLNYKAGLRGKEFYWHSDFETWHAEDGMPRMRALSVSILLSPNRTVNGPLLVIPKSHNTYVACAGDTPKDHYKQSLRRQVYGVPDDLLLTQLVQDNGIEAVLGEAGTIVIFDCNMMHGSNGNITPWPRSNVFIVYNAMSNQLVDPFGVELPRPDFIATRGKISAIRPLSGRFD